MSKFSKWAGNGSSFTKARPRKASRTVPTAPPAPEGHLPVVLYTSDGRPVQVTQAPLPEQHPRHPQVVSRNNPGRIVHPQQVRPVRTRHARECMIVKQDGAPWTRKLNQMRDLTADGIVDNLNPEGVNMLEVKDRGQFIAHLEGVYGEHQGSLDDASHVKGITASARGGDDRVNF